MAGLVSIGPQGPLSTHYYLPSRQWTAHRNSQPYRWLHATHLLQASMAVYSIDSVVAL